MRRIVIGLVMALAVQSAVLGSAAAATDPHALNLAASAFPAGAFITHEHVDRTAAQVDAEGLVGNPTTQGNFYQQLHFSGSLFESARLPSFNGAQRELWLLATIFPSAATATQALSADARFNQCDQSPALPVSSHMATCAYINWQGPESGMYVVAAVGPVEFIVVGFVHSASSAARYRAVRDASYLAMHEVGHVEHLLASGLLTSG